MDGFVRADRRRPFTAETRSTQSSEQMPTKGLLFSPRPLRPSGKCFRMFFLALALVIALLASATPARAEVVHIGISTPGLYEIPTEIAQRKGFYKEEGLDVRKVVIRTTLQVAALMAG
jgi:hypothetical protein